MRSTRTMFATLAISGAVVAAAGAEDLTCKLCSNPTEVVHLSQVDLMGRAEQMAAHNMATIGRIDRDLKAGAFGPPSSARARQHANVVARLSLQNWYAFLFPLAIDSARVYVIDREAVAAVGSRYAEPGIFPAAHLKELRLGRGGVCARYDLARNDEGWTVMGGRGHRFRVRSRRIQGVSRRVLEIEWASAAAGKSKVVLAETYSFRVAVVEAPGEVPTRVFFAYDIRGTWIRKAGLHRPTGFAFWTSSPDALGRPAAGHAIGSAIYIPDLKLRLPLFLPDFGLNDLRHLGLPLPFLEARRIENGELPAWLVSGGREHEIVTWDGAGPVPVAISARFPDR